MSEELKKLQAAIESLNKERNWEFICGEVVLSGGFNSSPLTFEAASVSLHDSYIFIDRRGMIKFWHWGERILSIEDDEHLSKDEGSIHLNLEKSLEFFIGMLNPSSPYHHLVSKKWWTK